MNHCGVVVGTFSATPPAAAREAFGQHLIAHPVESHFEVFHACRVDNRIEERLENDQTVNGDADRQRHNRIEAFKRHDAILAVNDEPDDSRHPAQNESADNQQRRDDGLSTHTQMCLNAK